MTPQQIKDNAPRGATHYTHEPDYSVISYWSIVNGKIASWSDEDNGWITYRQYQGYTDYIIGISKPL